MNSVFNNGIGFVVVVEPSEAEDTVSFLSAMNTEVHIIGDIVPREPGAEAVTVVGK